MIFDHESGFQKSESMILWFEEFSPEEYNSAINHPACIKVPLPKCPICEESDDLLNLDCKDLMCRFCFIQQASRSQTDNKKPQISCPVCYQKTPIGKIVLIIKVIAGKSYRISLNDLTWKVDDLMDYLAIKIGPDLRLSKNGVDLVPHDFDPTFDTNPPVLSWVDSEVKDPIGERRISSSREILLHATQDSSVDQMMTFTVETFVHPLLTIEIRKSRSVRYLHHLIRQRLNRLGEYGNWSIMHNGSEVDQYDKREVQEVLGPYTGEPGLLTAFREESL